MKNKFTIDYFLKNPEFIRWVRVPDNESTKFWKTFANNYPETKDEMQKAAEIIRTLKLRRDLPKENFKQEILDNIVSRISIPPKKPKTILPNIWKYAAVILITVGVAFTFYKMSTFKSTVVTALNEQQDFTREVQVGAKMQSKLPDGSSVWINSGSRIEYFEDTLSNTRNVVLQGEAFFDVVKNQSIPFIVTTQDVSVRVFGTAFNVRAYQNKANIEVALLSGKVVVSKNGNDDAGLELLPGEKAILEANNQEFTKQEIDYPYDLGWKDGILAFKRADFKFIKEQLEQWYGIRIFVSDEKDFSGWEVDGQYDNKSLDMVLMHLGYAKEFSFRIDEENIYLTKIK